MNDSAQSVTSSAPHHLYSNRYRYYVLALLTLGYVFNFVDRQVMTILIEPIKAEFGATDTQMGFLSGPHSRCFMPPWVYRWLVLPTDGQDAMYLPSP